MRLSSRESDEREIQERDGDFNIVKSKWKSLKSFEWGGADVLMGEREKGNKKSGFALCILIYWPRLIDGRALYRGLAFPVGRTTS